MKQINTGGRIGVHGFITIPMTRILAAGDGQDRTVVVYFDIDVGATAGVLSGQRCTSC